MIVMGLNANPITQNTEKKPVGLSNKSRPQKAKANIMQLVSEKQ